MSGRDGTDLYTNIFRRLTQGTSCIEKQTMFVSAGTRERAKTAASWQPSIDRATLVRDTGSKLSVGDEGRKVWKRKRAYIPDFRSLGLRYDSSCLQVLAFHHKTNLWRKSYEAHDHFRKLARNCTLSHVPCVSVPYYDIHHQPYKTYVSSLSWHLLVPELYFWCLSLNSKIWAPASQVHLHISVQVEWMLCCVH